MAAQQQVKTEAERYAGLVRLVESRTVTRMSPPLLLPASPYFDLAGEEFGRNLLLTTANNGVEYCLRPDFTLPIAQSYLDDGMLGVPSAYTYLGTIFRQQNGQPVEHEQAGLELLGQPDPEQALDQVLTFARWALAIYDITAPEIRLGGVGLFEAFLNAAEVPDAWQSRIRHRFGHPEALGRLMERLANPDERNKGPAPDGRETVIEIVTDAMLSAGLSLIGSRTPDEIADRYIEKQALDAAPIPPETVALLQDYLAVAEGAQTALDRIGLMCRDHGFDFDEPLFHVRNHAAALAALSPKADVLFDASFSPRLDYYTGIVFEMTGSDGEVLASGGEYDRLIDRLGANQPVTASGCALWVDRLEEGGVAMSAVPGGLTLAVPSKGRLEELTRKAFTSSRLTIARPGGARSYIGAIKNQPQVTVRFYPAAEIARELILGGVDIGVTGTDLIHEASENGEENVLFVRGLGFGEANVVVAIPDSWIDVQQMTDLADVASDFRARHGRWLRVATKYVNLTRRHFAKYGIAEYRIVESAGATEAAPAAGSADLIVDITSTGSTLAANQLRVLEDGLIMRSEANLVVSRTADWTPLRKAQLEALLSIMGGVPPGISTLL